ncbi:NAD(P)/FAD-dependent oxidoreductase [Natrialba sp. INN-245]|uniref:NAD(P)/FAD-dependent oxidoreductase n=1 Tax=Natrialba sp. INN-245 TaxID=2690967 RepID=UPI0013107765|nr:NAD(P)/FAD-dependent oxidoreductase [Natrialba sp. INN-245]MWV39939.1 FAD-dependent oxidoreductase [Natrialba sp. INN-245]
MKSTPRVVVVGGGLAGLVAARHLAGGGVDVTLTERRPSLGGRVRTTVRDGYRFDDGFQVLFTAYPAVRRELDLEALDLRPFAPGATIARGGHRSPLVDPLRAPRAFPAALFTPDVTFGDKLRVAKLRWALRNRTFDELLESPGDSSIDAYLRGMGFSDRFLERFAAPFYGGITLDRSLSTSKRIFEYTFKALSAGDTAVPAAGMEAIPGQLADFAEAEGATIETDAAVESVSTDVASRSGTDVDASDPADETVVVETTDGTYNADAAVVATDPPTARSITGVDSIPTDARGCVTQYYALPADSGIGSARRIVLNADPDSAGPNHVVPTSEVAPEYAPEDVTLISATYLGDRTETDEELAETTRDTLESWYPERAFDGFSLEHTDRIPFAQFVQPPGFHAGLPDVCDPDGAVYLAGDYTRWSSIQGAMESGRQAAKAVLEDLSG